MSRYTRLASTDEQERAIAKLERKLEAKGIKLKGGTTIGKSPQTVILDLTYQGGEIRINSDGEVDVDNVSDSEASEIKGMVKYDYDDDYDDDYD